MSWLWVQFRTSLGAVIYRIGHSLIRLGCRIGTGGTLEEYYEHLKKKEL